MLSTALTSSASAAKPVSSTATAKAVAEATTGADLAATSKTTWTAPSGVYTLTLDGSNLWINLNGQSGIAGAPGQVVIRTFTKTGAYLFAERTVWDSAANEAEFIQPRWCHGWR
jgi:hypothetical protein